MKYHTKSTIDAKSSSSASHIHSNHNLGEDPPRLALQIPTRISDTEWCKVMHYPCVMTQCNHYHLTTIGQAAYRLKYQWILPPPSSDKSDHRNGCLLQQLTIGMSAIPNTTILPITTIMPKQQSTVVGRTKAVFFVQAVLTSLPNLGKNNVTPAYADGNKLDSSLWLNFARQPALPQSILGT